jgi:hypothetical protein
LKSANIDFEEEKKKRSVLPTTKLKYREVREKLKFNSTHTQNGSLAYWGDEVLNSFNLTTFKAMKPKNTL